MRLGSVGIVSGLLVLQAILLVGGVLYQVAQVNWHLEISELTSKPEAVEAILVISVFSPMAIMAVAAAVCFLIRFRIAWSLAMVTQGLCLAGSLSLRLGQGVSLTYAAVMVYAMIMVLYLNSSEVRLAFRIR
jgi:hypothetical protein